MSFPASPVLNEVFIADGKAWKFDGTNWVIPKRENTLPWELVTGKPTYFPADWSSTVANIPDYFNAKVISSQFPPTNQVTGTLWWDEVNNRLYVYQSNVWVETSVALREKFISIDPDVINYVTAVEAADGAPLEQEVVTAFEVFILGCKVDGIWNSIKASCILAGARTRNAAFTPLVGTAPVLGVETPQFNASFYNRKTGHGTGPGTASNPLNGFSTSRNQIDDPQLDRHISVFFTTGPNTPTGANGQIIGSNNGSFITSGLDGNYVIAAGTASTGSNVNSVIPNATTGLIGASRGPNSGSYSQSSLTPSTHFTQYGAGNSYDVSRSATSISSQEINVFRYGGNYPAQLPRISFYSIGESIDLEKLDARVTKLMTTLSTAIP